MHTLTQSLSRTLIYTFLLFLSLTFNFSLSVSLRVLAQLGPLPFFSFLTLSHHIFHAYTSHPFLSLSYTQTQPLFPIRWPCTRRVGIRGQSPSGWMPTTQRVYATSCFEITSSFYTSIFCLISILIEIRIFLLVLFAIFREFFVFFFGNFLFVRDIYIFFLSPYSLPFSCDERSATATLSCLCCPWPSTKKHRTSACR